MTLFIERGYDQVTVAQIAERANLTKRSFFNHFADKREVMFASADALQASVLTALAETDRDLSPMERAVQAFTRASAPIADFPELARARRAIIDSSPELRERDLLKMAQMVEAIAEALVSRGITRRHAVFVAQAATTVFIAAVDDWVQDPQRELRAVIRTALTDLQAALATGDCPDRVKSDLGG
ncbi:TetR/AcrR family transcriptional regulator [Mycobacterium colombiense]|nr:TetR family transcriptional regulator [Mycobacterium colombiense]